MSEELIIVKQLPVIEEHLREIKEAVANRVQAVLDLECNEGTYKEVKKARADLSKEFAILEENRKTVKRAILEPYNNFEALYKECASDTYKNADLELKHRITEVEDNLRQERRKKVKAYFEEYKLSLGIDSDFVTFERMPININLSATFKSYQTQVKTFLDNIAQDIDLIDQLPDRDEVMAEYKKTLKLTAAMASVEARHRAVEEERKKREAAAAEKAARKEAERRTAQVLEEEKVREEAAEPEQIAPPIAAPVPEKKFSTVFRVTGTITQLKALKTFLTDGGYDYEQL